MVLLILECLLVMFRTIFGHFWAGQSKPPRLMQWSLLVGGGVSHAIIMPIWILKSSIHLTIFTFWNLNSFSFVPNIIGDELLIWLGPAALGEYTVYLFLIGWLFDLCRAVNSIWSLWLFGRFKVFDKLQRQGTFFLNLFSSWW